MNAKGFFLRFDVIRKVSRSVLVLWLIVFFFARSWSLGTGGIVFLAVTFLLCAVGSVLRTVKPYRLSEFISSSRHAFETEVKKENKSFRHGDPVIFYAYSREKEALSRALGRRLLYPVCLNMMFLRHGKGGTLIVGRLSLWDNERATKEKYKFSDLTVSWLRLDGDAEMLSVGFYEGDAERIRFYVRDDHFWKTFLTYAKETCHVTEESV